MPSDSQPESLPPGTTAEQFAARIATEINDLTATLPGISAKVDVIDKTKFTIDYVDSQSRGITLYVGDTTGCQVTKTGCSFNPTTKLLPLVGGIAEAPDAEASALGATASGGSSGTTYAVIAGIAAGAVLLGAGGWYARRRWLI